MTPGKIARDIVAAVIGKLEDVIPGHLEDRLLEKPEVVAWCQARTQELLDRVKDDVKQDVDAALDRLIDEG